MEQPMEEPVEELPPVKLAMGEPQLNVTVAPELDLQECTHILPQHVEFTMHRLHSAVTSKNPYEHIVVHDIFHPHVYSCILAHLPKPGANYGGTLSKVGPWIVGRRRDRGGVRVGTAGRWMRAEWRNATDEFWNRPMTCMQHSRCVC